MLKNVKCQLFDEIMTEQHVGVYKFPSLLNMKKQYIYTSSYVDLQL